MSDVPPGESLQPGTKETTLAEDPKAEGTPPVTPQRCLLGSVIAGVMAYAMYLMTNSIAVSFATHKVQSTSLIVQRISSAVRTLVIGMTTLGMGVFGLAAIGLLALALQILWQRRTQSSN